LAPASKVRQRPSGDRAWRRSTASIIRGESRRLTPPASARSLSPARRLPQARWTATEEAVSMKDLVPALLKKEGF
jgi:hypothetical protein